MEGRSVYIDGGQDGHALDGNILLLACQQMSTVLDKKGSAKSLGFILLGL